MLKIAAKILATTFGAALCGFVFFAIGACAAVQGGADPSTLSVVITCAMGAIGGAVGGAIGLMMVE